MKLRFHHRIIDSFKEFSNCELLWIIGPSHDGTREDLLQLEQRVVKTDSNSRAERINIGIAATQNPLVLLNHPRSFLSSEAITQLSALNLENKKVWGGFTHEFYRSNNPILNFTSLYSNKIRFGLSGIIYLDHCIFFTRNLIAREDPEPVPVVDIFEDTLLSRKLLKQAKPVRIMEKSCTSPIRFTSNGIFRQSMMNQTLKLKFALGYSSGKLNRDYEKNLNLNSDY